VISVAKGVQGYKVQDSGVSIFSLPLSACIGVHQRLDSLLIFSVFICVYLRLKRIGFGDFYSVCFRVFPWLIGFTL